MCKTTCRLCKRLIISDAVTFDGTSLVINIPAGSYSDGCKYCIVVAQTIPATATINAPVVVTIGDGTVQYPVTRCDCSPATACNIHTRTRYSFRVETSATSGVFRMLCHSCNGCDNNLASIDGTVPGGG
jgi:hypothetical protein